MTLTAKQEAFCQAIISGKSGIDAYFACYAAKNRPAATVEASRLLASPNIALRIAQLRQPANEAVAITLAQHLEDLRIIRDKALMDGKWGPAVAAELGRGKASGLHITKIEDVTDPLKKAIGNMPADKAQEMLDALDQMETIRKKAKSAA